MDCRGGPAFKSTLTARPSAIVGGAVSRWRWSARGGGNACRQAGPAEPRRLVHLRADAGQARWCRMNICEGRPCRSLHRRPAIARQRCASARRRALRRSSPIARARPTGARCGGAAGRSIDGTATANTIAGRGRCARHRQGARGGTLARPRAAPGDVLRGGRDCRRGERWDRSANARLALRTPPARRGKWLTQAASACIVSRCLCCAILAPPR